MEPIHQFQDETFTEWLTAMPDTLHWTLAVSPSRIVRGLQDGSLREYWRRESHRLPEIDAGRTEMWADSLVAHATHRLRENVEYRAVPTSRKSVAPERAGLAYPMEYASLATPELSLRLSIAIRDSSRARIMHAHALIADDWDEAARRAARTHINSMPPPQDLKCTQQVLGILEVKSANFADAATHFLNADATAVASGLSDEQCWTSRTNLLMCALTLRSNDLISTSIALMNLCTDLSSTFKRNALRRMLDVDRPEYAIDLETLRSFEHQMSESTREFMHGIT